MAEATPQGDWTRDEAALTREWSFTDFRAALAWVNRVGELAEAQGHHPDILLHGYDRVRLTLSTHTAGAVTEADDRLAAAIDAL